MKRWAAFWKAVDVARTVPRVALVACGWMTWHATQWFMALKDPSAPQSAFVMTVYGVVPLILNFYMSNGVKWEQPTATVTTATATTTTKEAKASDA